MQGQSEPAWIPGLSYLLERARVLARYGLERHPEESDEGRSKAVEITEEIKARTFDYLKWFPHGNKAHEFRPKAEPQSVEPTVGDYYKKWIEGKKPPAVRKGQERDYKEHFRRYILPQFETVNLKELSVSPRKLLDFRTYLTGERGLKMKSARTIIDASFRAMVRDARKIDHLIDSDPFAALDWPRLPTPKPDPFTEEDRDKILQAFKEKSRFYYPFVHLLFWTGMRPSEALALRWEDIDIKHGFLSISKSRYMDAENGTKTAGSEREIRFAAGCQKSSKCSKRRNRCAWGSTSTSLRTRKANC